MSRKLPDFIGFDWDDGNRSKNKAKHNVTESEAEELFFNIPLVLLDDLKHSSKESRFAAFGRTDQGRALMIIFTMRGQLLRVISARDMNQKEEVFYEQNEKKEASKI